MKFYSETLNKLFDSSEECAKAEADYKKKLEEKKAAEQKKAETRKARAQEVEDAMKAAAEARANYEKLLAAFCKDYGTFHYSFSNDDSKDLKSLFDIFF